MEWVQNATIRSPIGAPEVVWHDVKHVWIFFETSDILWSCWLIWQNRSRISIIVIQVTKSNFPTTTTSKKVPQMIATTTDNQKQRHSRSHRKYLYLWRFGSRCDLARSAEKLWPLTVCEEETPALQTVLTMPDERFWNCKLQSLLWILYCRNSDLLDWKTPKHFGQKCADVYDHGYYCRSIRKCMGYILSSKIYNISTDTNVSGIGGYVAISGYLYRCGNHLGHFLWTRCGRKPHCRFNFDAIYHSSRDISTSGLGCHIAIFGCRSLSHHFLWTRHGRNPRFAVGNKYIYCSST